VYNEHVTKGTRDKITSMKIREFLTGEMERIFKIFPESNLPFIQKQGKDLIFYSFRENIKTNIFIASQVLTLHDIGILNDRHFKANLPT
jgi:hypothetical protein